jgi:hypothetical protein
MATKDFPHETVRVFRQLLTGRRTLFSHFFPNNLPVLAPSRSISLLFQGGPEW